MRTYKNDLEPVIVQAARRCDLNAIKSILENDSSQLNKSFRLTGQTALHIAAFTTEQGSNAVEMVKFLLECGANVNQKDVSGKTPFILSCKRWNENISALLIQHGASVSSMINELPKYCFRILNTCVNFSEMSAENLEKLNNELLEHPGFANISQKILTCMMLKLGEWRPKKHAHYPRMFRQALSTVNHLAKAQDPSQQCR